MLNIEMSKEELKNADEVLSNVYQMLRNREEMKAVRCVNVNRILLNKLSFTEEKTVEDIFNDYFYGEEDWEQARNSLRNFILDLRTKIRCIFDLMDAEEDLKLHLK